MSSAGTLAEDDSILDGLPTTVPKHQYKGIQQCLDIISLEDHLLKGDPTRKGAGYVIFTNINVQTFLCDFVQSDEKLLTGSWKSFDPNTGVIIIRMEAGTHAAMSRHFADCISEKVRDMGLRRALIMTGGMTIEGQKAQGGEAKKKRADESFEPVTLPFGRDRKWPSLVLEVAYTETRAKIEKDMRFWLEESDGAVKTAITASVHQRTGDIILEEWQMKRQPTKNNPQGMAPFHTQYMRISRPRGQEEAKVTGDPLTIEFENLFLRPPTGLQEKNIVITADDLKEMAELVWAKWVREKK